MNPHAASAAAQPTNFFGTASSHLQMISDSSQDLAQAVPQLMAQSMNSSMLQPMNQQIAQPLMQATEDMMMPAQPRNPRKHSSQEDMGRISLSDLFGGINEGLFSEMQEMAPTVIDALMRQDENMKNKAAEKAAIQQGEDEEMYAVERSYEPSRKRAMNSGSEATDLGSVGDDQGQRKVHRAEKNRISAARSREKKRAHIDELKRRVAMLSAENAQLQVEQWQAFQERIEKERRLRLENVQLGIKVDETKEKLKDAKMRLQEKGIEVDNNKRHTWSSGEWSKRN